MNNNEQNDHPNELATLLIPLSDYQLIVPNVAVAEIIKFKDTAVEDDRPMWFKGYMEWREHNIPLVSYEAINDEPFEGRGQNKRIVVLNGLAKSSMPFFALIAQGVPKSLRIVKEDIVQDKNHDNGPMEQMGVFVAGEPAVIPDLEKIQDEIVGTLGII